MDEADAVDALERLGLTSYQAQVFIALQKLGAGTARDVHRITDVPRSQVYSAAENLQDRGLVEIQQSSPIRYRPVSIEEAESTLRERFDRERERAFEYVERVREQRREDAAEEQEDIWTIRGRSHVADRTVELVRAAEDWIVYGVPAPDLLTDAVAGALLDRAADGVAVTVVTADEPVRERFADADVDVVGPPSYLAESDSHAGRVCYADDDVLLLSVLGPDDLPGIDGETAFWSAHTNVASVLIRLIEVSLGAPRG